MDVCDLDWKMAFGLHVTLICLSCSRGEVVVSKGMVVAHKAMSIPNGCTTCITPVIIIESQPIKQAFWGNGDFVFNCSCGMHTLARGCSQKPCTVLPLAGPESTHQSFVRKHCGFVVVNDFDMVPALSFITPP